MFPIMSLAKAQDLSIGTLSPLSIDLDTVQPIHISPDVSLYPIAKVHEKPLTVLTPMVMTPQSILLSEPSPDSPILTSVNLGYSQPLVGSYTNLNADPRIHKRLSKYFMFKTLDDWLYNDLNYVLNYVDINGPGITYVPEGVSNNKNDKDKIKKIEEHILTQQFMQQLLSEFTLENSVNWYHLYKNEKKLKKIVADKMIAKLKKEMKKENNN